MGGNIFKKASRIKREAIRPTVEYIVDTLAIPEFTLEYAMLSLLGSAGKQESSGDLDFSMNTSPARFVGEVDRPVFDLHVVRDLMKAKLHETCFTDVGIGNDQLNSLFPVAGDENQGFVQCDFMFGDFEYSQFSHWSPGENSRWKGLLVNTVHGGLAKMKVDHVTDRTHVGLAFDITDGLTRLWRYIKKGSIYLSVTTADEFETMFDVPRFPRIGFVTSVPDILEILWGVPTRFDEVDTFEKCAAKACAEFDVDKLKKLRDSVLNSLSMNRYFDRYGGTPDEVEAMLINAEHK